MDYKNQSDIEKQANMVVETGFSDQEDCFERVNDEKNACLRKDNRGIGVVEIVLILVVLIALIIIFKDKIMEIINSAFESITEGAESL